MGAPRGSERGSGVHRHALPAPVQRHIIQLPEED